jgi:uncharacterized protein
VSKNFVRLSSGKIYRYGAEDPRDNKLSIHDIAAHLSKECRFGGATRVFYSVAQHAVLTSLLVEEAGGTAAAMHALHHDDHEVPLKDWMTPLKDELFERTGSNALDKLAEEADECVYASLSLTWPVPKHIIPMIKEADMRMYITEGMQLVRGFVNAYPQYAPAPFTITPLGPDAAETLYLSRHQNLVKALGRRVA